MGYITTAPWIFVDSEGEKTELECHCRFQANNTGMMLEVALAGLGIVYGPGFAFARHLAAGNLVPVLASYTLPVLPLQAVTPTAKYMNVKTRLFIERLALAFKEAAPWNQWRDSFGAATTTVE